MCRQYKMYSKKGREGVIISVMNQKGGCGKTTTAWAMASVLRSKGKNVLLVDLDPQVSLSLLLQLDDSRTIADVIKGKYDITDVIQTVDNNGDAVAGSAELPLLDSLQERLKAVLKKADRYYDYVIVDSTPTASMVGISILQASDKLVIPAQATLPVLLATKQFKDMIELAKEENPKLDVSGILLVMYDKRGVVTRTLKEIAEDVAGELGTKVYDTTIRKGIAVEEAWASFKGLIEYAPNSNPAIDYIALVEEMGV